MNSLTKNNSKFGLYAVLMFIIICVLAILPVTAHAATITVAPSGGDYTDIQSAITAASNDDIINVAAGTYTITSPITIDKYIQLVGADEATTIIQAGGTLASMIEVSTPSTSGTLTAIEISGFTLDGTGATNEVSRGITSASPVPLTLSSVTINDVTHTSASVIGVYVLEDTTLTNVTMSNIGRFGIYSDAATAASAIDLTIDGLDYSGKNSATEIDYAVEAMNGVQMTMTNSSIVNCSGLSTGTPQIASVAVVGATGASAPATTDIQITNTEFTNNYINVALGMSSSENGSTASASGCSFDVVAGGYNIDTYSASALNFENNYWGTTSATEIDGTIHINGSSGSVDYIPYYMENTLTTTTDNYLQNLAFSAGTLDSAFDSGDLAYTLTVPYSVSSITATPTAFVGTATITVDGNTVASGADSGAISLTAGSDTVFDVVVNSTVTYTITAHRQTSNRLTALTVSEGGGGSAITLSPTFDPDTLAYTFLIEGTYTTVDIAATAEDAGGATVTGTGASIALTGSPFTVACESSEGVTQNYVITAVTPSTDASLSGIVYNGASLTGFASSTYSYAQTVSNAISSITLSATPTDTNATYTINGAAPASSYALSVGANVFTILVTAQDGTTQLTYTLTVTREAAASNNANLSALTVNGTSVTGFDAAVTAYTVVVPSTSTTATVAATAQDASATMTGTGSITLNATGATSAPVVVTAADGTTTKTYTISIVKSTSNDAQLANLTLDGTTVTGFSATTYSYAANVTAASVTIGAVANDLGATVAGTGVKTLNYGANVFTITVTASDGTTTQNYLITITRGGEHDATLKELKVDGIWVQNFDANKLYYYGYTAYNATSATITAIPTSDAATVTGAGTFAVSPGETGKNITVTAPDGVTKKTYRVTLVVPYANMPQLRDLTLDGVTIPNFAYHKYEYVNKLPSTTANVVLGATPLISGTVVSGTGTKSLAYGGNDFTLTSTSPNGSKQNYHVTLFRGYLRDATLKNITYNGKTISGFSATDTYYTLTVSNSTKSFKLGATTKDPYASVSGAGTKSLSVGTNTFKLVVTADDDKTTKTYKVVVTRKSSSTTTSSSGSSSGDDDDDDDDDTTTGDGTDGTTGDGTDNGGVEVINPTSEVDVTEDVLLKDTTNDMDGTTYLLLVDDDAFLEAIKNALAKKKLEEGDGTKGVLAHPYVSFPKANSVDGEQSVKVVLDGAGVKSAFNQEVGLILTLDNYTLIVQPKSFSSDFVDDEVEDYLFAKRLLSEEEKVAADESFGEDKELIYAAETKIEYATKNGVDGVQETLSEPVSVSIMLDSEIADMIDEAESISDIAVFVTDGSGNKMAISFQYDSTSRTLQFSTKQLGEIYITRSKAAMATPTTAPTDAPKPVENNSTTKFPPILIAIIVGALILLGLIIFLIIKRSGTPQMDQDEDINI